MNFWLIFLHTCDPQNRVLIPNLLYENWKILLYILEILMGDNKNHFCSLNNNGLTNFSVNYYLQV